MFRYQPPNLKQQQNQGNNRDGKAPTRRPENHEAFEEIKENSFFDGRAKVAIRERQYHRQRVFSVMLQASRICIFEVIQRRVIVVHIADVSEVDALISGGLEHGEIRIVRELLVNLVENRTGGGTRGML